MAHVCTQKVYKHVCKYAYSDQQNLKACVCMYIYIYVACTHVCVCMYVRLYTQLFVLLLLANGDNVSQCMVNSDKSILSDNQVFL